MPAALQRGDLAGKYRPNAVRNGADAGARQGGSAVAGFMGDEEL